MNIIELSYVIPAYNASRTIKICVESIKASMLFSPEISYEIIVIDNNSTDNTPDILSALDIILIVEKKQGRSYARNSGLRRSKGKYVAFIDADVYLRPLWAKNLIALFNKENVGGVQGKIIPCKEHGSKSLNEYRFWAIGHDTKSSFCLPRVKASESPMINSAACLYLKKALLEVDGFNVHLERHEDIDLAKRVFLSGYNLASSESAEAMVIFHGDGWWDYFKRSFADGFYKYKYTYRWAEYYTASGLPHVNQNKKPASTLLNQARYYLGKAFEEEEFFWFVKIGLMLFNAAGRISGMIWYKINNYHLKRLQTFKLVSSSAPQFIFFDDGHYQINLANNELLDFTHNLPANKITDESLK
ncbi:MAG: glycosyltransferase family 2 protein [Rhizobacter sp.]|nr:glycosyltransferase family 2 protein [Bacteriovorax sp.]